MKAHFERKATDIQVLLDNRNASNQNPFTIEETVELDAAAYRAFTHTLLADHDFIAERKAMMRCEQGTYHCILVKAKGASDGILVEADGYDYARYAAYYAGETNGRQTKVIEKIAKEHLGLDSLETQHSDQLDFHERAVWTIKAALEAAYQAGFEAGKSAER